jgi:hypothetical protein
MCGCKKTDHRTFYGMLCDMELTGIEPATFRMRSGRSATELQPHVLLAIVLHLHTYTFLLQTRHSANH